MQLTASLCIFTAGLALAWDHLSESDFTRAISGHNHALVAFIEPSTPASKALEPEWLSVAATEKALASIDCSEQKQLCRDYDVASFPALRFFDGHGTMTRYRGPRTAASITAYLKRAVRPAITTFADEAQARAFETVDDVVIVARLNRQDEHLRANLDALAGQYADRASFGLLRLTDDDDQPSAVVCYNNPDGLKSSAADLAAIEALPELVTGCLTALIGDFSRRNEGRYLQSGKSIVYYFAASPAERAMYVAFMRPLAKKFAEYLAFVTVDADEYGDMLPMLGVPRGRAPALAVQNPAYGQVFPFRPGPGGGGGGGSISPQTVEQFVMDIVGGKVKPWDGVLEEPVEEEPAEAAPGHDEL